VFMLFTEFTKAINAYDIDGLDFSFGGSWPHSDLFLFTARWCWGFASCNSVPATLWHLQSSCPQPFSSLVVNPPCLLHCHLLSFWVCIDTVWPGISGASMKSAMKNSNSCTFSTLFCSRFTCSTFTCFSYG